MTTTKRIVCPNVPSGLKPLHAYRVKTNFADLKTDQIIKILSLNWRHDPGDWPPRNVLQINYAGSINPVRLYEEGDQAILSEMNGYLEEMGTFSREEGMVDLKQTLTSHNSRAAEEQKIMKELEDVQLKMEIELLRKDFPEASSKELYRIYLKRTPR